MLTKPNRSVYSLFKPEDKGFFNDIALNPLNKSERFQKVNGMLELTINYELVSKLDLNRLKSLCVLWTGFAGLWWRF